MMERGSKLKPNPLNLKTCHKHKVSLVSKPLKRTRNTNCKNIVVFNLMEPNAPNEFTRSDKIIILSGMIEFNVNASEEIREDICDVIQASKSRGFDPSAHQMTSNLLSLLESLSWN